MIRLFLILILILLVVVYTVIDAVICFFISLFDRDFVRRHSIIVSKVIFKLVILISGVRVYVAGEENIKSLSDEKAYFIISNHRGFFDIITGYLLFDREVRIVAKKEFEKIPVFSYWMRRIGCIFLDRNDIRDGVKMVLDSINNINNGISMWVFPEGTRCKSANATDLLEFKGGAFKISEKTNCYILPMSFRNTEKAFEKQKPFLKPTDIYINIGKPYKMSELNEDDRRDIANYSQKYMKKLLSEDMKWQRL